MADECWSSIKGLAARVTRLDSCCKPVGGATGMAVSCGFVKVDYKANIEDGTEYKVKTASGALCISEKDCPQFDWYDLSIEFCQIDPELFEILVGQRITHDAAGNSVGFAMSQVKCPQRFALEVWTQIAGQSCDAVQEYGYFLLPCVSNAILGDFTIEDGPLSMSITANTRAAQKDSTVPLPAPGTANQSVWNRGPYALKPLEEAVIAGEHLVVAKTTVAPPACACGYQLVA